ncbi:MAG: type II toxin-antitoxin system YhaV family toxin [Betaproteobacteria bacterium]|nr:type II toxin-antitoxin system YhaV family toxin [Betaproteobacteria bacterium]
MTGPAPALTANGWSLFAHPLFLDQVEALISEVERLKAKDPKNYKHKNSSKRLAAIARLAFDIIPIDPTRPEFRLGTSLGEDRKYWFRAKFYQQYRLFFRFHAAQRIIIYAWVNDEDTKRAYSSRTDAYRTFGRMLDSGRPPEDWDKLLVEAKRGVDRMRRLSSETGDSS